MSCMYVSVCEGWRKSSGIFPRNHLPCFLETVSPWDLSSMIRFSWLYSKPQQPACPCLQGYIQAQPHPAFDMGAGIRTRVFMLTELFPRALKLFLKINYVPCLRLRGACLLCHTCWGGRGQVAGRDSVLPPRLKSGGPA